MTSATRTLSPLDGIVSRTTIELNKIIRLALPIWVAHLAMTATGFVDTMMAGNYSNDALAGAAVGSSICFPFIIALSGLMMSVTPITAHLFGGGKVREAGPIVRQAFWLGLFCAALLYVGMKYTDPLFELMHLSPEVSEIVRGYQQGISIGFPAVALYFVLNSFAEGVGKTRPQMVISVICVGFNYVANDILIHGKLGLPALGGAGCGWASGLTFWVFLILMAGYVMRSSSCREAGVFSHFEWPSISGIIDILKLGLPIGGTIFMECSIFACITLFIGVLGPVVVGGHQIALNYSSLIFSLPLSIGMALTIRAGHAIGGGDNHEARFACIVGCILASVLSLVTITLTLVFSEEIVGVYTKDPEVSKMAVSLLCLGVIYQLPDAIMTASQGGLRGYKDTKMTMVLTFVAYWLITLPLGYTLSMTNFLVPAMGAAGFWISLIVGLSLSGLLLSFRLGKISRQRILDPA